MILRMAAIVFLAVVVVACGDGVQGEGRSGAEAAEDGAATPPVATYQMRGRVLEAFDGEKLAVRHEAVPDLVGIGGAVEPMAEMSMRFPVSEDVPAASLAEGDLISFELSVDWARRPPHRIESLEQLPAETPLELQR